jgi:hypothetical protein
MAEGENWRGSVVKRKERRVVLYVEGASNQSKFQQELLRSGFQKLFEKAGLKNKPSTFPCGSRSKAYAAFCKHLRLQENGIPILLVDSESVCDIPSSQISDALVWRFLENRMEDQWKMPNGVGVNQVGLMATCMETWLVADRKAFVAYFGKGVKESALPKGQLENQTPQALLRAMKSATKECKNVYAKGDDTFRLLGKIEPTELRPILPHFNRFIEMLEFHLS